MVFPDNLPVWDLTSSGLVIATFFISGIRGVLFSVENNFVHVARNENKIYRWDYDTQVFVADVELSSGTTWSNTLLAVTGSSLQAGGSLLIEFPTQSEVSYRAVPV